MTVRLINEGVLVEKDGLYEFARDYLFNSPTTAGSIVIGYVAFASSLPPHPSQIEEGALTIFDKEVLKQLRDVLEW